MIWRVFYLLFGICFCLDLGLCLRASFIETRANCWRFKSKQKSAKITVQKKKRIFYVKSSEESTLKSEVRHLISNQDMIIEKFLSRLILRSITLVGLFWRKIMQVIVIWPTFNFSTFFSRFLKSSQRSPVKMSTKKFLQILSWREIWLVFSFKYWKNFYWKPLKVKIYLLPKWRVLNTKHVIKIFSHLCKYSYSQKSTWLTK